MTAPRASFINATLLVVLSLWGYLSSETPSMTALIPTFFGVALLAMNNGLKKENKIISHVAVILTVLILIGLIKPLQGALGREDTMAIARVGIMLASTVVALFYFVKYFMDARKAKAGE